MEYKKAEVEALAREKEHEEWEKEHMRREDMDIKDEEM